MSEKLKKVWFANLTDVDLEISVYIGKVGYLNVIVKRAGPKHIIRGGLQGEVEVDQSEDE